MMKTMTHTYKAWIVTMLMAMVLFPSCERESFEVTFQANESNTLTLKLLCSENVESRTVDNTNNEDAIHRLDIFLYPNTANFYTPATYSKTIDKLTSNESHTVNLTLDNTTITNLFGTTGTTCKVYVIANRPDATKLDASKTSVNELKAMEIEATFAIKTPQTDFVMDSDFSIDGDNVVVTLDRQTHALSGTVPLYRAASKISLIIDEVIDVPMTDADGNPIYQTDENGNLIKDEKGENIPIVWQANTEGMLVRMHDGVSRSTIDCSVAHYTIQKTDTQNDYFNFISDNEMKLEASGNDWVHNPSFYSYSSDWGKSTPDEEPYLTLIVPWQRSNETNAYQRTYYQVPISTIAKNLSRNHHYKIYLKVSRLGSFVEEVPEEITPSSYIIVPWQREPVNADLLDYRYLMVEEKNITIYNEDELYIPYATSHPAKIVESTINFYQQDITGADPVWETIGTNSSNRYNTLQLVTTEEGTQIYFKNELDNLYTNPTFDFTPYKLTFTIQHEDNEDYYEEVTIIQYPAIYGEVEQNWDYSNDYYGQTGTDGNNGFTYVNGYQGTSNGNYDFFGSVNGLSGNSSSSPNRYIFTVTSVEGTKYVIGDPRDNSYTYEADDAKWAVAKALFDGSSNRELKYYYGTDVTSDLYTTSTNTNEIYTTDEAAEAAERTINMIAPKFRIASGYAVLNTGGTGMYILENLKKRCASYQEDGYPAGRWRLPTKAEFEFIVSQVNKGTLPQIYIDDTQYWCAHGLGTPDGNGKVTMKYVARDANGHSVRCVYDEWYWTDKLETPAEKNVFTWGDQPR